MSSLKVTLNLSTHTEMNIERPTSNFERKKMKKQK